MEKQLIVHWTMFYFLFLCFKINIREITTARFIKEHEPWTVYKKRNQSVHIFLSIICQMAMNHNPKTNTNPIVYYLKKYFLKDICQKYSKRNMTGNLWSLLKSYFSDRLFRHHSSHPCIGRYWCHHRLYYHTFHNCC